MIYLTALLLLIIIAQIFAYTRASARFDAHMADAERRLRNLRETNMNAKHRLRRQRTMLDDVTAQINGYRSAASQATTELGNIKCAVKANVSKLVGQGYRNKHNTIEKSAALRGLQRLVGEE